MTRVAALYLPEWAVERWVAQHTPRDAGPSARSATGPVRAEGRAASDPAGARSASDDTAGFARGAVAALATHVASEQRNACSVPRGGGWRPGARWARTEVAAAIQQLPAHQRPPMRELGRRTEPAPHPFKAMRPDEGGAPNPPPPGGGGARSATEGAGGGTLTVSAPSVRLRLPPPPGGGGSTTPLVLAHKTGPRVTIYAACAQARALGIRPGMALTQARAQTPGLIVRDADLAGDAADLARLADRLARRWAPNVAIDGAAGLLIDITGVAHLHGGERAMAAQLVRLLGRRGLSARVAIADTVGAAHALARCVPGPVTICPPGEGMASIAPLPVGSLRLEDRAVELLRRLGIDTVGQLAAMPRGPLARRFGPDLVRRLLQASGELPEPIVPVATPEPIVVAQRFAEPIASAEAIDHWLAQLVPPLIEALAQAGLGARRIELVADRVDNVAQRLVIGLARASRDGAHLLRLLRRRIETVEPGYGIDAMALHVRRAEPLTPEPVGGELGEPDTDLAPLVDTLATRGSRTWRVAPVESDVPERSVTPAPPLDPPARSSQALRADDVRRLDTRAVPPAWHPDWPRPVRLLHRPEPIDNVIALMPDGAPRRFVWRGRSYAVARADGPERIAGEWWRRTGERSAIRDYFCVEDGEGTRFWLYRRGDGERDVTGDRRWFLHGWLG